MVRISIDINIKRKSTLEAMKHMPINAKPGRYRAPDRLLAFLESL